MTSIPFGIVKICNSLFKCNYMIDKKHFRWVLFHLSNLHEILNIFAKKKIVIADTFPKLQNVKLFVDHSIKSAVSDHPLAVNVLMGVKHLSNLHETTFIIFFDYSEGK